MFKFNILVSYSPVPFVGDITEFDGYLFPGYWNS